jgi:hypothetical protein
MSEFLQSWGMIHPSALSQGTGWIRWVAASIRPHGALRYRCPVTSSFVVVTDDVMLARLSRPHARLRCLSCGEFHLLTQEPHHVGDRSMTAAQAMTQERHLR